MFKFRLSAWGINKNPNDHSYQLCAVLYHRRRDMDKRNTAFVTNGNTTRSVKDLRKYVKGRKLSDAKFLEIALANTSIQEAESDRSVRAVTPESEESEDFDALDTDTTAAVPGGAFVERWKEAITARPQGTNDTRYFRRTRKSLPLLFQGRRVDSTADTGSSENAMDLHTAKSLGLLVQPNDHGTGNFVLANGTPFKSIGQVETYCSFGNESNHKQEYSIKFNVFRRLATSVIIGLEFLKETLTLTKHQHRLEQRLEASGGPCRIMHFNRPSKGLPCYINDELVNTNADTGADMNLVTPAMARRCLQTGRTLQREHLEVEYADGSPGTIWASFTATLSPGAHSSKSPDVVDTTFYVLEGLTSTALLGHQTLDEIDAFVRYENAFVDMAVNGNAQPFDLIFWARSRSTGILTRKKRTGVEQRNGLSEFDRYGLPEFDLSENSFRQGLAIADAREDDRRSTTEEAFQHLPHRQKDVAIAAEHERHRKYLNARIRCLAEYQAFHAGPGRDAIA